MYLRKGDMVCVIAGDDADLTHSRRVLRVLAGEDKVVVEGVNRVYKHMKRNQRAQQGGRLSKEMGIAVSNVLLYCPSCKRGRRIGRRYGSDGHKERFCKKCGSGLGSLSKPRPKYAKT